MTLNQTLKESKTPYCRYEKVRGDWWNTTGIIGDTLHDLGAHETFKEAQKVGHDWVAQVLKDRAGMEAGN